MKKTMIKDEIDRDYVLVECDLEKLKKLVETLESMYDVRIIKEPSICLTMIRAEDSIENQEFYLGEAITTECEVGINGAMGYGICLGEEPERAYCLAVVDAIMESGKAIPPEIEIFLAEAHHELKLAEQIEFNHVMRTQVDFKLFDEE
jgi:alpha-D-ribose 1-methylphosphonate 5-triphosphate synthase subunit PhnG